MSHDCRFQNLTPDFYDTGRDWKALNYEVKKTWRISGWRMCQKPVDTDPFSSGDGAKSTK